MSNDTHINVDGIVAVRNGEPYVRLTVNGERAQLTIAEAKKIATDLFSLTARTEADAMIWKFFKDRDLPLEGAALLMQEFRVFRQRQDEMPVEQTVADPDSGERIR